MATAETLSNKGHNIAKAKHGGKMRRHLKRMANKARRLTKIDDDMPTRVTKGWAD